MNAKTELVETNQSSDSTGVTIASRRGLLKSVRELVPRRGGPSNLPAVQSEAGTRPEYTEVAFEAPARKWPWRAITLFIVAVVPTLIVAWYMVFVARNQYISEFRFNLRAASAIARAEDALSSLGAGGMNPAVIWDSNVVVQYIKSEEVVRMLENTVGFRAIYSRTDADYFHRLPKDATFEEMTDYWKGVVDPFFDMTTGVISVKVRAFTPEDALKVSNAVLKGAESVVNDMSQRSRKDAYAQSEQEVRSAEDKLREIEIKVRDFRNKSQVIDPGKQTEIDMQLQGRQTEQLGELKARYDVLKQYLAPTAPSIQLLKSQIDAMETLINSGQRQLTAPTQPPTNDASRTSAKPAPLDAGKSNIRSMVISEYQALIVEEGFREKMYAYAQESMQKARMEADRQQVYLNAFVFPRLPEDSRYPLRIKTVALTFVAAFVVWLLGLLLFYGVRDHI